MLKLGVFWEANPKAWMTGAIFEKWLDKFNARMQSLGGKVLMLVDNAPCPCHIRRSMSNVHLLFLPPNMTSKLQPLEQGIIQAFKLQYRGLMLRWLLTRMHECESATDLTKKINVLEALPWSHADCPGSEPLNEKDEAEDTCDVRSASSQEALLAIETLKSFVFAAGAMPSNAYDSILERKREVKNFILNNIQELLRQTDLHTFMSRNDKI
ncbi:tigger transposable element-derived protein 6-like [Galendromus occidentalis]|uniref:Tigger transposable element-derived protein 6-like n=1 Tax=Galendromus occidentalis TaxID=34638 RepID=A0AAJ6QR72_9ACAR|nr:tigger transposable element-derived protein 6-like [Galendromus occidentalis]